MAALKDIKRKITAVQKTRQITRAMNMVAASKFKAAQTRMENFRPYAAKFMEVLNSLALRVDAETHPLLAVREPKRIRVICMTSDRGLCGGLQHQPDQGHRTVHQREDPRGPGGFAHPRRPEGPGLFPEEGDAHQRPCRCIRPIRHDARRGDRRGRHPAVRRRGVRRAVRHLQRVRQCGRPPAHRGPALPPPLHRERE